MAHPGNMTVTFGDMLHRMPCHGRPLGVFGPRIFHVVMRADMSGIIQRPHQRHPIVRLSSNKGQWVSSVIEWTLYLTFSIFIEQEIHIFG